MESAEEDAGAATNACRPVAALAARETRDEKPEPAAAGASCPRDTAPDGAPPDTPAMADDTFDGDSVPSPEAHDINTSTEAILDMIDEIVDGPGAPKRLPLLSDPHLDSDPDIVPAVDHGASTLPTDRCASDDFSVIGENFNKSNRDESVSHSSEPSSATSAKSENLLHANVSPPPTIRTDFSPTYSAPANTISEFSVDSPQASSSVLELIDEAVSEATVNQCISNIETQSEQPIPNIPTSSEESVLSDPHSAECHSSERTVSCIESSAQSEKVTIESAESTSDNSSSVEHVTVQESSTRSPLRRRLVRPAPIDRRPDTTVSSTVDSQSNVQMMDSVVGDSLTKDVSSSSDAVTSRQDRQNERFHDIREVSICKAETSVSPPKRIKLVRHKILPQSTPITTTKFSKDATENQVCQSTSSDVPSASLLEPVNQMSPSVNCISTTESTSQALNFSTVSDCISIEPQKQNIDDSHKETANVVGEVPVPLQLIENADLTKDSPSISENYRDCLSQNPPMLNLNQPSSSQTSETQHKIDSESITKCNESNTDSTPDQPDIKVPKLTIKFSNKQPEEPKPVVPKLTIKTVRRADNEENSKICDEVIPNVTKINIKPILKPPEKICEIHRKSSSSDVSESDSSENDDSASTSDQTSASDQGPSEIVPKVTIKLGKPGTETEGQFYTEKNIPKLTIKNIHTESQETEESSSKIKLMVCQPEETHSAKIPKLTIKPITRSLESQPLSPKLTIKPIKLHERNSGIGENVENLQIPKLKIIQDMCDVKESAHVPKITIKPVTKVEETSVKSTKKGSMRTDGAVLTKLNIKPIIKPVESNDYTDEGMDESEDKVPVVPKLNIKPIVKPKDVIRDNRLDSNSEEVRKITKINIKPLKEPDNETLKSQECEWETKNEDNIPKVTKINIKPIIKPSVNELKEVDFPESGSAAYDSIQVVPKLTIKPIIKPHDIQDIGTSGLTKIQDIESIPLVAKINIKPILKPEETTTPPSPKKERNSDIKNTDIPVIKKLNIKPIVKPENHDTLSKTQKSKDKNEETFVKHPPLVMKINIKAMSDMTNAENIQSSVNDIANVNNLDHGQCNNIKDLEMESCDISQNSKNTELNKICIPEKIMAIQKQTDSDVAVDAVIDSKSTTLESNCVSLELGDKVIENQECLDEIISKSSATEIESKKPVKMHCLLPKSNSTHKIPVENKNELSVATHSITETTPINEINESKSIESIEDRLTDQEFARMDKAKEVNTEIPPLDKSETQMQITMPKVKDKINTPIEGIKLEQNFQLLKRLLERDKDKNDSLENKTVQLKTSGSVNILEKLLAHDVDKANKVNFVDSMCDDNAVSEVIDNTGLCIVDQQTLTNKEESQLNTSTNLKFQESDKQTVDSDSKEQRSVLTETLSRPPLDLSKSKSIILNPVKSIDSETLTKPLEIETSEKTSLESSGQDSPRIILKINKTEQGASSKLITDETKSTEVVNSTCKTENTQSLVYDKSIPCRNISNTRKKKTDIELPNLTMGKRLRSSKVIQEAEKTPTIKRNVGKRPSVDNSISPPKEPELSVLETKRMRLGQLLSNKSLTITPLSKKVPEVTNINKQTEITIKQLPGKNVNHSLLKNENCSKNGNSKLHNILSNLHAKHELQVTPYNEANCTSNKSKPVMQEDSTNTSTGSSDVVEITAVHNSHLEVQEMLINENSNSNEFNTIPEDVSQDPLDIDSSKASAEHTSSGLVSDSPLNIRVPPITPQPRRRGRPRKLPVSEGSKPITLPVPALEERPQRSLRLSRGQPSPVSMVKPRGRGRGRGFKRGLLTTTETPSTPKPLVETANKFFLDEQKQKEKEEESSNLAIKLPRLTEALEKMPSVCSTPLSSRKDSSDVLLFSDTPELKVMLESIPKLEESLLKSPLIETPRGRGRGRGRGSRGGRPPRTPRGRGRRGGGRGAMYMKETMGIYGRVCGPATTTVQLFEEETCMMDDNATPAKPEMMDEDSQSSVKSSTNDSSKTKKSKFADLFDSNKVWTAADVKEYMWPPPNMPDVNRQVMMIQEQVAMFLGVKSFKRRYPELKRRAITTEEREYVLSKEIVTEALCDLGITAVDASEVLDIMLSDYPHKYEEYRSHQRQRQLSEPPPAPPEPASPVPEKKPEEKEKTEVKTEVKPPETKPEPMPEKNRQDMAAAAILAASEFNTRLNALRRPACVDLQTMTIHKRRNPLPSPPPPRVRPAAGFYPHALLPGQYQHWCRTYTPEQLRYFPLNTVLEAPPPPASVKPCETSSESEVEWGSTSSSEESDNERSTSCKRKKLTKIRSEGGSESRDAEDRCGKCGLREEATRKHHHERFLVCGNCNAKLHPSCLDLGPDTVRKCRGYTWQCAECKSCGACSRPADDDKMLFCDLCDRGFHIYCVGLSNVPTGRWHCVECSICKSCGARTPAGVSGAAAASSGAEPEWHHQSKRGPGGHKIYSHSLCAPCARMR